MRAALFLCLSLCLSGCSFFATEGPRPPPGPTACNFDSRPVVADAIAGVGAGLASAVASIEHGRSGDVIVPLAVSGMFTASSAYGYVQVRRCRAARETRPTWSLADMPAVM